MFPTEVPSLVQVVSVTTLFSETILSSVFTVAFGGISVVAVVAGERLFCRAGLALEDLGLGRSTSAGEDDDVDTVAAAGDAVAAVGVLSSLEAARRPRISDFQRILTASSVRPCW